LIFCAVGITTTAATPISIFKATQSFFVVAAVAAFTGVASRAAPSCAAPIERSWRGRHVAAVTAAIANAAVTACSVKIKKTSLPAVGEDRTRVKEVALAPCIASSIIRFPKSALTYEYGIRYTRSYGDVVFPA
jgi:hypothetical protein